MRNAEASLSASRICESHAFSAFMRIHCVVHSASACFLYMNASQEYFKNMPWLAVPFVARSAQAAMASRFKVHGIPALVLIENGEVINASARGAIMKDPMGAGFPWRGQEEQAGSAELTHIGMLVASYILSPFCFTASAASRLGTIDVNTSRSP